MDGLHPHDTRPRLRPKTVSEVVSVHRRKLPHTPMTHLSATPPTDSVSVRRYLCDALRIDLVGPRPEDAAGFTGRRREVAEELVRRASRVADRTRPASRYWAKRTCSKPSASPTGRWPPPRAAGGRWRKGSDRGTSRRRRGVRSSLPTS